MYIYTLAAHIRERGNEWRPFQVEACSRCDHGRGCRRAS